MISVQVTSTASFERLKDWARELDETGPESIVLGVTGNKCDLDDRRQVSKDVASAYAKEIGAFFIETSAKDNLGVADLFSSVANRVPSIGLPDDRADAADQFRLDTRRSKGSKRCCF